MHGGGTFPCITRQEAWINHYFCKSKEEWIVRRALGKADQIGNERTLSEFYTYDAEANVVYNPRALQYVHEISNAGNQFNDRFVEEWNIFKEKRKYIFRCFVTVIFPVFLLYDLMLSVMRRIKKKIG